MPSVRARLHPLAGAVCLALSFAAVGAPSAGATPVFPAAAGSPLTLTGPGVTSYSSPEPAVAVNAEGASVAAWTVSMERANKFVVGEARLEVSFRAAGAPNDAWSKPLVLSAPDRIAGAPEVGIDAKGTATVAWTEFTNGTTVPDRIRVTTASSGVVAPIQDFTATTQDFGAIALAVAPTGAAVLAYDAWRGAGSTQGPERWVGLMRRPDASSAFVATPSTVSGDASEAYAYAPAVSANAAGQFAVAWEERATFEGASRIRALQAKDLTAVGTAFDVTTGADPDGHAPEIVVEPSGAATVGWTEPRTSQGGTTKPVAVVARRVSADGALESRQTLGSGMVPSSDSYDAQLELASDAAGRVTAAWILPSGETLSTKSTVEVAAAPAAGTFGTPVKLTDFAESPDLSLAVEASGATAVAFGGAGQVLGVVWRAAGASNFVGLGKVSDRWAQPVSIAFGRGPDDLTLLFGTDYAPIFIVQTATTISAPPSPTPLPAGTPVPTATPAPARDTTAPTVTIGAVTKAPGPKPKKGRKRTSVLTVVVSTSEPAQVSASISQTRPGIQRGGQCVARPSDPKQRRGRKTCVRTVTVGKPERASVGTANATLDFGTAPAAGTYTVTVKATDAAGNKATPATKRFTLR